MSGKILRFPSAGAVSTPIGHFLRLGDSGVRALGDLIAGGHLLPDRVPVAKIESLIRRMEDNADALDKTRTALEKLHRDLGVGAFAPKSLRSRQAQKSLFDIEGKF
jgi:hypothetical protein